MTQDQDAGPQDHEGRDELDAALAEAFGRDDDSSGASILDRLAAQAHVAPRIRLREAPSGPATSASDGGDVTRNRGKYRIHGEVARGGVGVVLKGYDADLGRDVAMKLLHTQHQDNGEMIERFVEEAQIGAQLQHPGIVPVYDLGLDEDRPFFTMKLIRGRTLSSVLRERPSVERGQRRFVGIFEQICQTVAYAHARGVIHRDLKPSNVMVGAFGEVQIVDWGLGKVLLGGDDKPRARRETKEGSVATVRTQVEGSSSAVGSAMGTPGYMPPEQALGATEDMDERADVFSLGAILAEILTGQPPYAAPEPMERLRMARNAELDECMARLDACGADAELVELARDCLAPARNLRPRHAKEVADRVLAHLESIEERKRAAELAATEQRIVADEERKRRKLTVGLAAVILTGVLGGGWLAKDRLDRQQRDVLTAKDRIARLTTLAAEARASGSLAAWEAAAEAATGTGDLLERLDVAPDIRAQAGVVVADITAGREAAIAADATQRLEARTAAALETIRARIGGGYALAEVEARFRAAFEGLGLDVEHTAEADCAERIEASGIRGELCDALDEWAEACVRMTGDGAERAARFARIADLSDSEPLRRQLRAARGDAAAVKALVNQSDPVVLSPGSVVQLAGALAATAGLDEALAYMRRAQLQHPEDFWINFRLGRWLSDAGKQADLQEAVGFLRAAIAAQPENPVPHHVLGIVHQRQRAWDEALAALELAFALEPENRILNAQLYEIREKLGLLDRTLADLQQQEETALTAWRIGVVYRIRRQFADAAKQFRRATELDDTFVQAWRGLGFSLRRRGQLKEASVALARATDLAPENAHVWLILGETYGGQQRWDEAIEAYERAVQAEPTWPWFRLRLATVLVRSGRNPSAALAQYEEMRRLHPDAEGMIDLENGLASVLKDAGRDDDARAIATRSIGRCENRLNDPTQSDEQRASLWELIGSLRMNVLQDYRGGADAMERSLGVIRTRARARIGYGVAQSYLGDLEGAESVFDAVVEEHPKFALARRWLADTLVARGKLAAAIEHYRAYVKLVSDADAVVPHLRLGMLLLSVGRADDAVEHLEAHHRLAYGSEGTTASSAAWQRDIETLKRLATDTSDILAGKREIEASEQVLLGMLLHESNRTPDAARIYREALDADPDLVARTLYGSTAWRVGALAAQAAAQAASGRGRAPGTVNAEEAARLHAEARTRLRAELQWATDELEAHGRESAAHIVTTLLAWRNGFASACFGAAADAMTLEDRQAWDALWQDVTALLRHAHEVAQPTR